MFSCWSEKLDVPPAASGETNRSTTLGGAVSSHVTWDRRSGPVIVHALIHEYVLFTHSYIWSE